MNGLAYLLQLSPYVCELLEIEIGNVDHLLAALLLVGHRRGVGFVADRSMRKQECKDRQADADT